MKIHLTKHAKKKFIKFAEVGLIFSEDDVIQTIKEAEHLDDKTDPPKKIASRMISKRLVLRVVFKEEDAIITIITFYPAKKGRYYG